MIDINTVKKSNKKIKISMMVFMVAALAVLLLKNSLPASKKEPAAKETLTGTISVSGAFALYPLAIQWAEQFQRLHPDVRMNISAGGAGKGIADAAGGAVDIGMASRDLFPEEIAHGAVGIAVAKDAVVPTISEDNPWLKILLKKGIKKKALANLWISSGEKTWGPITGTGVHASIHVYTRSDASGAAETWAAFFGKKQEDLEGTGVFGDPGLEEAVKRDPLGIGYNNLAYVFDAKTRKPVQGIRILPVDFQGTPAGIYGNLNSMVSAVAAGKYPSPPTRNLFLVIKKGPQKRAAAEFIRWILSKGQTYVMTAGYVRLSKGEILEQRRRLKTNEENRK